MISEATRESRRVQCQFLVILSPGRSFSTVLSAMLGLHPDIVALPETCLFARDTMHDYIDGLGYGLFEAGLIHAVARLYFADAPQSRTLARGWIRDRRGLTTRVVLDELVARANRRIVVEKTPIITTKLEHMRRVESWLGESVRYLHLVRHPHTFGVSLIETASAMLRQATPEVAGRWFRDEESIFSSLRAPGTDELDPERPWVARNARIESFLECIPDRRWIRMRGEDVIANPAAALIHLCAWLGAPVGPAALDAMLHTENWEFASGPPGAAGGDRKFFADPALREVSAWPGSATSAVPWATDGRRLGNEAMEMAQRYGYV